MTAFHPFYETRKTLVDILRQDLLGPVDSEEIIHADTMSELPSKYYSLGILFPQKVEIDPEENERDLSETYGEKFDASINLTNSFRPSSMALSCTVKKDTQEVSIEVDYAWYERHYDDNSEKDTGNSSEVLPDQIEEKQGESDFEENTSMSDHNPSEMSDPGTDSEKKPEPDCGSWKRFASKENFVVTLESGKQKQSLYREGLELQVIPYQKFEDGSRSLTVALVNQNHGTMSALEISGKSFFQPKITLSSVDGNPVIIAKKNRYPLLTAEESINLELLHRFRPVFGVGHGCSVEWIATEDGREAMEVYTSFIPEYELNQMKPVTDNVPQDVLSQKFLAEAALSTISTSLKELPRNYQGWIEQSREDLKDDPDLLDREKKILFKNLENCDESRKIIESSIELLERDPLVFKAFQLANQAMLEQRLRFLTNQGGNPDPGRIRWYPFQLAFILQEISSTANSQDPNREKVDLLWFPTGGGKTEAYLGLIAFSIFLRRLRATKEKRSGSGVTALMRYTLRLLTLQQFQRASLLICACEYLRREKPQELGTEEISIGLWVGESMTPTHLFEGEGNASESLQIVKERGYDALSRHNPCQIRRCPWCGEEIRPMHYSVEDRMIISCPSKECDFHKGLPLYLVDQDIYNQRPSLIVSTIDKFARMAWEPKVKNLFNIGSKERPPELIIQDELHLISGPLGTISALYELAIRKMCVNDGKGAKIIASTATVQNAAFHVKGLYNQEVRQFPPHGTDIRDSFFARESGIEEMPSRLYCGIMAPSISPTTLLVRVYAALLFATRYLACTGSDKQVIDNYWSLVGYFNSLRELGGAVVQILDDVQDRLEYLSSKKFQSLDPPAELANTRFVNYRELNSRSGASAIAESLELLEIPYPKGGVLDEVLATNMISVGVDVGRLGLMIVEGQPKTNAEYIQATSRVGRKNPGLVITLYNAGKSRDRSHYEQFSGYHFRLNCHVESTSLTPFSARARERALHAAFIGMCRCLVPELAGNSEAGKFDAKAEYVEEFREWILSAVRNIDQLEEESTGRELDAFIKFWTSLTGDRLKYFSYGPGSRNEKTLIARSEERSGYGIPTLNSMRNVDVESNIFLEE